MDIDEKRVYGDRTGKQVVYLGSDAGLVTVQVSGAHVGGFNLSRKCTARDVATGAGTVLVATDEDVLHGEELQPTGFGPAVTVTVDPNGDLIAAAPDGRVGRYTDNEWLTCGELDEIRALDGQLIASDEGVHRLTEDGLTHVGLDDARDVTASPAPYAATTDGLYRLGNGWLEERQGSFSLVSGGRGMVHAATSGTLYEYTDDWQVCQTPVNEPFVGVGYGGGVYAVTANGTFLARETSNASDWRSMSLGLADVRALAVR